MLECIEVFSSRNMSQVVSYFTAQLLCECGLKSGSEDYKLKKLVLACLRGFCSP